jgi:glycosyltransferase involved in cell wall biosynthesis
MTRMPKLLFISSIAVPHQVKFCYALQNYFNAEFWFYEMPDRTRGAWWRVDLGANCKLLNDVLFFKSSPMEGKYWAMGLIKKLNECNPDIVMLGGFSIPSNLSAYFWAKKNGKKTIVFTERSRNQQGVLRKRGLTWFLLRWLYRDVDMVMTSAEDAVKQFRDEFGFGEKVIAGRYAADLEAYFHHPLREAKPAYTYLFANRMTMIYNPVGAIEIFARVLAKYPNSRLLMNAAGELGESCREKIAELKLGCAVEFLSEIQSWDQLHRVYEKSDILILPANFSNGNYTILEAMASGMGVVVSDRVLGMGGMLENGLNCFKCEPTTDAFLSRIDIYISNPQLFNLHASINRPLVKPLAVEGTAKFFAEAVMKRLNI